MIVILIIIAVYLVVIVCCLSSDRKTVDNLEFRDQKIQYVTGYKNGLAQAIVQTDDNKFHLVMLDENYELALKTTTEPIPYSIITEEGKTYIDWFYFDHIIVENHNVRYLYDKNLQEVPLPYDYFDYQGLQRGYIIVRRDNKYGIINKDLQEVVPTIYDSIEYEKEDLFKATKDNKERVLNANAGSIINQEITTNYN